MKFNIGETVGVVFPEVDATAKGMVIAETDSFEYLVWVETQQLQLSVDQLKGITTMTGNMLKVKSEFLKMWEEPTVTTRFNKEHGHQERIKG